MLKCIVEFYNYPKTGEARKGLVSLSFYSPWDKKIKCWDKPRSVLTVKVALIMQVNNLFSRQDALNMRQTLAEAMKKVIVDCNNGVSLWDMVVCTASHSCSDGTTTLVMEKDDVASKKRSGRERKGKK
jgi:hypothetical protein